MKNVISVIIGLLITQFVVSQTPEWPAVSYETKPWSRWWWPGSIVTQKDLSTVMEQYNAAGLGGLELTVLYGVKGKEDEFISFLSPEWMKMFEHTLKEAKRIKMGIDLANASSWPFGGPWVTDEDASRYVAFKTYTLKGGETLDEKIEYIQESYVRWNSPFRKDIGEIIDPVNKNPDLQLLAIDQVRFKKPVPLVALVAYSADGKAIDITGRVDDKGKVNWRAPAGNWTLYAVFMGWHGKMVERAGPGGEGYVIDHFSGDAIKNYLSRFDRAFEGYDLSHLRGFFNDSYEVDDAKGQSDWTPDLFDEFLKRRGYDLREHLPALFQKERPEKNARVLSDYRLTVSELILDRFTKEWNDWAHKQGKITRNQSHGSPGNILDLYAASDIPETEGTDILRMKFGTSAANVTGKRLASAEALTWLDEHFSSNLHDMKKAVDRYFSAGVNHIIYHGTCFSPPDEPWPGFHFYAAVELNPSNPVWADFNALNSYITKVQSFMQSGKPDNDILLYFPVFDRYADYNNTMLEHFDGISQRFNDTHFKNIATFMSEKGYAFDFVSDNQINNCTVVDGEIVTEGGARYKTIVVPQCSYIPLMTFNKLVNLAGEGAVIIFYGEMPGDIPGFTNLEMNREYFAYLKDQLKFSEQNQNGVRIAITGQGFVFQGDNPYALFTGAKIRRETMSDEGLIFFRRKEGNITIYYVNNPSDKPFEGFIKPEAGFKSAAIFNPMTGEKGKAIIKQPSGEKPGIFIKLAPYESMIVKTYSSSISGEFYPFFTKSGEPVKISGEWNLRFTDGGPSIPAPVTLNEPALWTDLEGSDYKNFSGSAVYAIRFEKPSLKGKYFLLDLGTVFESARVVLNGEYLCTLTGPEYSTVISGEKIKKTNLLEIRVTNLAANRIAYMDREGIAWKKFYNTNFPARLPQNRKDGLFDASKWPARPSGLKAPVTLTPVRQLKPSLK